jgi:hypothetical protein
MAPFYIASDHRKSPFQYSTGRVEPAAFTIELMYKAFEEHSNAMKSLKLEPAFDPLRSDPRFIELPHRVRLDRQ